MPKLCDGPRSIGPIYSTAALECNAVPVKKAVQTWRVIYSEPIENLCLGEILRLDAEVELTNDLGVSCEVVCKFVLGDDRDDVEGSAGAFVISGGGGENLTPQMHHMRARRTATWRNDVQTFGQRRVNFCVRTITSSTVPANAALSIEANGCRMTIDRSPPPT